MSTVSTSQPRNPAAPVPDADPYRYGWRDIPVHHPDGSVSFDQVPLTLEDVLFPETGDFIVHTETHDSDLNYLKDVFRARLAGDPHAEVVSDCRVDWNIPGVPALGPDIAMFFGIKRYADWATLNVAQEGAVPALVVEVTSPQSRGNDVEKKVDLYHAARVPLYVIADARVDTMENRRLELIAYRYQPDRFERIAPDHRGWIWLEPVRLWLGVTRDRRPGYDLLACYDPDTGEEIGDYVAITQTLEAAAESRARAEADAAISKDLAATAENRATTAENRATAAEARIRELEAELTRRAGTEPAGQ